MKPVFWLLCIKIKNPDGSLIDVKARHDEKMKRLAEEQAEKGN